MHSLHYWLGYLRRLTQAACFTVLAVLSANVNVAYADSVSIGSTTAARQKVSDDLLRAIDSPLVQKLNWVKVDDGRRLVKALIVAESSDVELDGLRRAVLDAGGSVYYRYVSVAALSVMLPASRVVDIARRRRC